MALSALALLFFSFGLISADPPLSGCIKVNQCKCLMRDGSGLIDLGSVAGEDGFLQRLKPLGSGQWADLLSFSPCVAFSSSSSSACSAVAACVIRRTRQDSLITEHLNYGRHEGNTFTYNHSQRTLTVAYYMFPAGEPQTVVHYRCSPNHSVTSSLSLSEREPLQMWVDSPCVCPSACAPVDVGPGTVLLIILCLSVTAYFIIGSCALRPFRTSAGVQMAPEDSVWCMICCQLTVRRRKRHRSLREDTL